MSLEEYSTGDPVSFVFLVDFNRKGEETFFNGITIVREETDYFFADLLEPLSGDTLEIYCRVTLADNLVKEINLG